MHFWKKPPVENTQVYHLFTSITLHIITQSKNVDVLAFKSKLFIKDYQYDLKISLVFEVTQEIGRVYDTILKVRQYFLSENVWDPKALYVHAAAIRSMLPIIATYEQRLRGMIRCGSRNV